MIYEYDPHARNERVEQTPRKSATVGALIAVAAVLALVIVAGTVVAYVSGSRQRKLARETAAAQPQSPGGPATFTDIGTLRAATIDAKPAVVIATIAFPYDGSDRAYREELIRKAPALKEAAVLWFSRRTAAELAPAYEGGIKAALRDTFNGLLSLGKVNEIWLSDFSVVQ